MAVALFLVAHSRDATSDTNVEGRKTGVGHCLHVFIASNISIVQQLATNYRRSRTIRDSTSHSISNIYAALLYPHAAAYIRVQLNTYTWSHGLHCGFKDQLTPCQTRNILHNVTPWIYERYMHLYY